MRKQQHEAVRRGKEAQLYFEQYCLREGWNVSVPVCDNVAYDVLIDWSHIYRGSVRAQVKRVWYSKGHPTINLTRQGRRYDPMEIDYIVAVDMEHDHIWIIRIRTEVGKGGALYKRTRVRLTEEWDIYKHEA